MKSEKRYNTGFTAGSLLLKEAEILINSIQNYQDYLKGKEELREELLPLKSETSKKRIISDLEKRFKSIQNPEFFSIFTRSQPFEKNLLLFYITIKHYSIIADFMLEIVRPKWNNLDYNLTIEDFKNFLFFKSDTHPELDKLKESTRTKMAQVVLRMLRELGLLEGNKLKQLKFEPAALEYIIRNDDLWFLDAILLSNEDKNLLPDL